MATTETVIWLVKNLLNIQIGTVVNNDPIQALKDARSTYGPGAWIEDSGDRKAKCCDKCRDTPCGGKSG